MRQSLAEKYYDVSPYTYCGNNPINAVDPDGRKNYLLPGAKGHNRPYITRWISSRVQGVSAVNQQGYLYLKSDSHTEGFSESYKE